MYHKYNGKVGSTEESPATQVLFESSDSAFRGIGAMSVRRHQLVLHIIGGEKILQSGRNLVVESFDFWFETLDRELLMDVIIGLDPF
jgi:hypothetical protein